MEQTLRNGYIMHDRMLNESVKEVAYLVVKNTSSRIRQTGLPTGQILASTLPTWTSWPLRVSIASHKMGKIMFTFWGACD